MMMMQGKNSGTTAVRDGFQLNEKALEGWLKSNIPDYQGPLAVEQFRGGQSNPTFKLITPRRSYVLRRRPKGVLMKGAHAIDREFKVLDRLGRSGVPVAHVYGLCLDEAVIGSIFYVMEMVEGRIFWDATVPGVAPEERGQIFDAMNRTMADLHSVDYHAAGLGDFGRAGGYFARQLDRWTRQYREDADAGRDPNMDDLIPWLEANIPSEDQTSLVHGDYRIDNLIFHETEPRVVAVLDWELATLGSPLADFTYHAMMYRMPPHIVAGLAGADLQSRGIPSEEEYVASYCQRTGRNGIVGYDFYLAFNFFRIAAIFHGIRGRVLRGSAASAEAKERAEAFPELARMALQQANL